MANSSRRKRKPRSFSRNSYKFQDNQTFKLRKSNLRYPQNLDPDPDETPDEFEDTADMFQETHLDPQNQEEFEDTAYEFKEPEDAFQDTHIPGSNSRYRLNKPQNPDLNPDLEIGVHNSAAEEVEERKLEIVVHTTAAEVVEDGLEIVAVHSSRRTRLLEAIIKNEIHSMKMEIINELHRSCSGATTASHTNRKIFTAARAINIHSHFGRFEMLSSMGDGR